MPQAITPGAVSGSSGEPPAADHRASKAANASSSSSAGVDGPGAKKVDLEIRRPPLEHLPYNTFSLSVLIGRLIQFSHNRLLDLVNSLQEPGLSDGDKKLRIITYAQDVRKQFIKVLVIVMWSENASAVSDVIDLRLWLSSRQQVFNNVVSALRNIRMAMSQARIPNSDLETANLILSRGRASIPMTKRYVPPPPLTPKEILNTLRNINTLLSIRLALHDTLPPHFRDYNIGSGRATFTVADEFEVDLSIGDEDPTSQLYLIDLRLTFEPAPRPVPPEVFRELEARGNAALKVKGLEGIYDFLHDYVMTNKILILQRQAQDMLARRWTENLRITLIKRTLVVQYWPNRVGEKSWIEVGVKRGVKGGPSRLGVRWFRENKEVKDEEVPLDVASLSAETLLKTVIAMHTKHILTTLRDKLLESQLFSAPGIVSLKTHSTDSFESSLKISLTPSRNCKIILEPITGRFALQKQTPLGLQVEQALNQQPANAYDYVLKYKFLSSQEEVENRAKTVGWDVMKMLSIRKEELKQWFPPNTRYLTYLRRKGWLKSWVMAVVFEEAGQSWWVAEIHEAPSQWSITAAERIPMKGEVNVTYQFLENMDRMAAGFITHFVNSRALSQRGTNHKLMASKAPVTYTSALHIPDLYIRFSSLIRASWGVDVLRVSFQGLTAVEGTCSCIVVGRTKEPMTQLGETNLTEADSDVSFHPPSGSYAIRFHVPVGTPIIAPLVETLQRIERLIRFVSVIRRFRLNCLLVSLGRIIFRYNSAATPSPSLTAEIEFSGDKAMRLVLPKRSPHVRVQIFLQQALNYYGLDAVLKGMMASLPLLLAVEELLAADVRLDNVLDVIPRNVDWFRLEYKRIRVCLDCRLRIRRSRAYWYVTDAAAADPPPPGRRVSEALKALWSEHGDKWEGLKTGAAAELEGVGDLLRRAHQKLVGEGAIPGVAPLPPKPS